MSAEGRLSQGRASRTAEYAAALRAGTAAFPPQLRPFEDPYARHFLRTPVLRRMPTSARVTRIAARAINAYYDGVVGQAVLRCRYADDTMSEAIASGVDQVVMLGSGYDATSVRWPAAEVRFFEVDHPETQAFKHAVLREHVPAQAFDRIVFVPCDFNADRPAERLLAHGFDAERPAFVNWLAVTWYLPRQAVEAALRELASVTAPGSLLLFDHLDPGTVDGSSPIAGARRSRRRSARVGEPYRFGITPSEVPGWLRPFGFEVHEQLSGAELDARYLPPGAPIYSCSYIGHVLAGRTDDPA